MRLCKFLQYLSLSVISILLFVPLIAQNLSREHELSGAGGAADRLPDPSIFIDASAYNLVTNESFTFDVKITGMDEDLRAYAITMTYNPAYLTIESPEDDITEGTFLNAAGDTQWYASGVEGQFTITGSILGGISTAATGDGTLFTVRMKSLNLATGTTPTPITLSDPILRGILNQDISLGSLSSAEVTIEKLMYLKLKAFLQGPYVPGGTMTHALTPYLPLVSPYDASVILSAFPVVSPLFIVDWINVQLRPTATGLVEQSQSVFMLSDGSIVNTEGSPNISFTHGSTTSYYIVLRHRNHLDIMSNVSHSLSLDPLTAPLVNLSVLGSVYGGDGRGAKIIQPGVLALFSGDADGNAIIQNLEIYSIIVPQVGLVGYHVSDVDLSGVVLNIDIYTYTVPNLGKSSQIP